MPAVKGEGMRGLSVFISDIRGCKLGPRLQNRLLGLNCVALFDIYLSPINVVNTNFCVF